MNGSQAGPIIAPSPLNSEFNTFLFASIGEEQNAMALTMLSALARLGIDPWQESARLAQLSPETATQRLTSIISGLPNGRWAPADAGTIATRLIKLLPAKRVFDAPGRVAASHFSPAKAQIAMLVFVAALGGLTFFAITNRVHTATEATVDSPISAPAALPQTPSAGAR